MSVSDSVFVSNFLNAGTKISEIQINQEHFELLVFKDVGDNRINKPWERILGCVYELFISVRDKKKIKIIFAFSKLTQIDK